MKPDRNNQAIFIRKETKPFFTSGIDLTGCINSSVWFDWPIGTWICYNPSWEKIKSKIWEATYKFEYKKETWSATIDTNIYNHVDIINPYRYGNFEILQLKESDWITT